MKRADRRTTGLNTRISTLLALVPAAVGAVTIAGSAARAQQQVGGAVPSLIALSIGTPSGFVRVGANEYQLRVPVEVSSTVDQVRLSIADGEDSGGPAHGHLHDGGRLLVAPLVASVAGSASQPLDGPADPLLKTWNGPVSLAPATVVLDQRLRGGSISASLQKTVLITISTDTP